MSHDDERADAVIPDEIDAPRDAVDVRVVPGDGKEIGVLKSTLKS